MTEADNTQGTAGQTGQAAAQAAPVQSPLQPPTATAPGLVLTAPAPTQPVAATAAPSLAPAVDPAALPAGVVEGLYVHVPFCARRCSYCDFSIAVRRVTPVDEYLRALDAELDRIVAEPLDELGGRTDVLPLHGENLLLDPEELRARCRELKNRQQFPLKAIIACSPANPTGKVFTLAELEAIASVCQEFDLLFVAWMDGRPGGSGYLV